MIETVLDTSSVVASIYGFCQVNNYHQKELERSKEKHEKIMTKAKENHNNSMVNTKKTYLLELFYSLDQHFLQLNADLISSGKESERDMFDQRSQNFQTLILAASVMFSALATVISQGYLPYTLDKKTIPVAATFLGGNITDAIVGQNYTATSVDNDSRGIYVDPAIYTSYALFCGLSFGSLFLTVVISSEIIQLASEFMYKRDKRNSDILRSALRETKKMMNNLMETDRGEEKNGSALNDSKKMMDNLETNQRGEKKGASMMNKQMETNQGAEKIGSSRKRNRQLVSSMDEVSVQVLLDPISLTNCYHNCM